MVPATSELIVSVSGIRGIVGTSLTPEAAARFAGALGATVSGGRVVVGRDSRPSGEMLKHAVVAGLTAAGCTVDDLGVVPTPTCGFAVKRLGAAGGVMITASHNPAPWNGLKLFGRDGAVLSGGRRPRGRPPVRDRRLPAGDLGHDRRAARAARRGRRPLARGARQHRRRQDRLAELHGLRRRQRRRGRPARRAAAPGTRLPSRATQLRPDRRLRSRPRADTGALDGRGPLGEADRQRRRLRPRPRRRPSSP